MKKLRKILLWTAGIAVGLLLVLVLGLKLFFPMDKAKAYALAEAEKTLGREVSIAEVDLSLSGGLGLRLQDVRIGNPADFPEDTPGEPFLTTDHVDLKVQLWPLLKGEVRGDRLVIQRPVARLVKLADGRDNFTFAPADAAAPAAAAAGDGEAAPLNAAIDHIEIQDGLLEFTDETAGTGVSLAGLELRSRLLSAADDILQAAGTLHAEGISLRGETPLELPATNLEFDLRYDQGARSAHLTAGELKTGEITLNLTGNMRGSGDDLEVDAEFAAQQVLVEHVLALAPPEAVEPLQGFAISGELAAAGDLEFVAARGEPLGYEARINATNVTVQAPDIEPELVVARAEATVRPDDAEIRILEASAGGEALTGTARIRDFLAPRVEARLQGGIDLALAGPYLDPDLQAELGGLAHFDVAAAGPVDDPDSLAVSGTATLEGVRFAAATLPEPIERLDGRFEFDRTQVTVHECRATTASSDFALAGVLSDPLPYFLPPEMRTEGQETPVPHLEFTATSGRLDVDRLFPQASPAAETANGTAAAAEKPLSEFPDITAGGTVAVDTMIYSGVEFTAIESKVEIRDRRIRCLDAGARVYTGSVAGETTIDLSDMENPGYEGRFEAKQIEAADFLARFTKFGGFFYGKFDLAGDFDAAGLEPDEIRNSLTLDSLADMTQGHIVTSGFAYEALSQLAGKAGQTFEADQGLKNLSTSVRAENGRILLDELKTGLGSLGDLALEGSYGFAGDLDFGGTLLLSEAQTQKMLASGGLVGQVAGLLGGRSGGGGGRLALPLTLGGSLAKPTLGVDYSALTRAAAEDVKQDLEDNLKKEVGDKLKDLFK